MNVNTLVIIGYFILMLIISLSFKKMASKSSSDYFRGGGRMLWWMVGATAFMTQFSAWTFTGAAGKAFSDGFAVTFVFFGNALGYLVSWWWFSHRFRQMRVDTPTEGVRARFGKTNEQFFTWAIIPLSILTGGVWLNGLAIFVSAVFGFELPLTIWITGISVLLISMLSGAWGVVASDFVQTLIIAVVSVACAIVALVVVGGPGEIVENFPGGFIMGPDMNYGVLLVGSFLFFLVKQLQSINNMQDSYRFLNAKDSRNARNAALFAMALMSVGSLIWFIPAWSSAILIPDAAVEYSGLGKKARDAVYLVFAEKIMPVGTVGLLVGGLFAATMSSMDSALCRNAGIFVRSFWSPIIRRNQPQSEKGLLITSQVVTVINGILVIIIAQLFAQLKELSLFELMMRVATLLQSPILVPLFFGMFIRKTPRWAAWGTVCFGMLVSWLVINVFTAQWAASLFDITLTARERSELTTTMTVAAHLLFTGGFFCLTTLFYRPSAFSPVERENAEQFFENIESPVIADDQQGEFDRIQQYKLGSITQLMGYGILLMVLIPNPLWGRIVFLGCAASILLIGYFLKRSGTLKHSKTPPVTAK
ncbi:sodium:solute symporter family transporter [Dryocola clanedunensis]|uniref:sodium:solute symporter family transporter n=1 Tax=Cedecea sulfonylureivorans TaxID=3051154 RepID=UPI0019260151|nr:transporter [Cedecea sulfonylureivorans]